MPCLYLGLDGGQSSTKALIADKSGTIIGEGLAGPCNHAGASEGRSKFHAAVGQCLAQACEQAHLNPERVEFAAVCLGFSGGTDDKTNYVRELIRSSKYKITHDAEIALSGATDGQPGIIVIAGTGSMAFGRNAENQTARAGGWGYIFGDEGGAFDIVRQALRVALKFEEGWGAETVLHKKLLAVTGARDINDLMHRCYTDEFPRDRVASLAPLVTAAAVAGDRAAKTILRLAAAQLTSLARGVHERLFDKFETVPVCYIGGVFRSDPVRINFAIDVHRTLCCNASAPLRCPAAGAVLEALRMDGNGSQLNGVPQSEC